jgi:thioredoxin-related protein
MNKSTLLLILTFITISAQSQNWITDFEKAKSKSLETGNNIVMVFSGSDWCAPCIKLDNQIWETTEFKEYAKENFILLRVDFPKRKKNALPKLQEEHNKKLAETYNKQGMFPMVIVLDGKGNVKGKTGYKNISPKEYIKLLESF